MGRDHSYECEGCGELRGGLDGSPCACDEIGSMSLMGLRYRMSMLAHNIGIGAALCRAYGLGAEYTWHAMIDNGTPALWRPGCGRPAP